MNEGTAITHVQRVLTIDDQTFSDRKKRKIPIVFERCVNDGGQICLAVSEESVSERTNAGESWWLKDGLMFRRLRYRRSKSTRKGQLDWK